MNEWVQTTLARGSRNSVVWLNWVKCYIARNRLVKRQRHNFYQACVFLAREWRQPAARKSKYCLSCGGEMERSGDLASGPLEKAFKKTKRAGRGDRPGGNLEANQVRGSTSGLRLAP
jgi:hypothetical protein